MRWFSELWKKQGDLGKLILVAIVLGGAWLCIGPRRILRGAWAFHEWLQAVDGERIGGQIAEFLMHHPLVSLFLIACVVLIAWLSQRKKAPTETPTVDHTSPKP